MKPLSNSILAASVLGPLLTFGAPAGARPPETLECLFTRASVRETVEFAPESFRIKPETLRLTFVIDGDRSYMVGNMGTAKVTLIRIDGGGLLFLEPVPLGTIQVTAIDAKGSAAHSRHTFLRLASGERVLLPAQHYGRCERKH